MKYDYDYFISYAHKDNESADNNSGFVDEFVRRLQESEEHRKMFGKEMNVFYDKTELHSMAEWDANIRLKLAGSRFLIVLLSPEYFKSEYCAKEFDWWMKHEMHRRVLGEGTAPMLIVDVAKMHDSEAETIPEIPEDLQVRFPNWFSQIRQIQLGPEFDMHDLDRDKISDALESLRNEVKDKVIRQDAAEESPHTNQYPKYNKNFVGRRENLRSLRLFLSANNEAPYSALTGLGGFGKTELALTYGHAFAWDYQLGRVFAKCENKTSIYEVILTSGIAEMHGCDLPKGSEEQQISYLFNRLKTMRNEIIKRNSNANYLRTQGAHILLILDNVNKLELISRNSLAVLPEYFHVIITTRENTNEFSYIHTESVESLSEDESVELLSNLRPFDDLDEAKEAREIAKLFAGFTMAVELTGAYLKKNQYITYKRQRELLYNNHAETFQKMANKTGDLTLHAAETMSAVLESTLSALSINSRKALDYATMMVPDTVALGWIPELLGLKEEEGWDVLNELTGYSLLIPMENEKNIARIHRLVANTVKQEIPEETRKEIISKIREKCNALLEKDERFWCVPKNVWNLAPIFEFGLALAEQWTLESSEEEIDWDVTKMLEKSGKTLKDLGKIDSALSVFNEFMRIAEARASVFSSDAVLRDQALALSDLGEMYSMTGNHVAAKESHTKAFNIRKSLAERQPDNVEIQSDLAESYLFLGTIDSAKGNSKEAKERYTAALSISEKLKAAQNNKVLRNLSNSYKLLGSLEQIVGNIVAAREWYEKSLEIDKLLVEKAPDDVKALRYLGVSYEMLGFLERDIGNRIAARDFYEKGLEIANRLAEQMPENVETQQSLTLSYFSLGVLEQVIGNTDAARRWFNKAQDTCQRLVDKMPENVVAQLHLSSVFTVSGKLEDAVGNTDAARKWFEKALEISKLLADKMPENVNVLQLLSASYYNLGDLETDAGKADAARKLYEKAMEINKRLADIMPENITAQRSMCMSYTKLGDFEKDAGNITAARDWYKKSLLITQQLAEKTPEDISVQQQLSALYILHAKLEKSDGNINAARTIYLKAIEISQRLIDKTPEDINVHILLSALCYNLGDLEKDAGNKDAAQTFYNKALDINQQLAGKAPEEIRVQEVLSVSYKNLGDLEEDAGNIDAARTYYEKAIEIHQRLIDKAPEDIRFQRGLCITYSRLADIEKDAGNINTARTFYEKAIEIHQRLTDKAPEDVRVLQELSISHLNLAILEKVAGNKEAAQTWFEKALDNNKRLAEQYPEDFIFQKLLRLSYIVHGDLEKDAGNTDAAQTWFEKALEIAQRLADKAPENEEAQQDLAEAKEKLAQLKKQPGVIALFKRIFKKLFKR